ncbi:MAG TPA: DUF485 domain-containing protein [Pseudonocardia sp.]|jgi:uncharacterized membrane protein (DUF485 family)|nr:DUF485 domain-containing protein [Pseudonocardia sp.]
MTLTSGPNARHNGPNRYRPAPAEPLFTRPTDDGQNLVGLRNEPVFTSLRSKQRRFIFPVSLLFMAWYMTFVLLAAYAHDFMSRPVLGLINMGMVLGLLQFVSSVVIMLAYCRYAKRVIDPATKRVQDHWEGRA